MTHESIRLLTESVCRKKVSNAELAKRLDALEQTCDGQFELIYEAIERLLRARAPRRNPIGFRANIRKKRKATPPKESAELVDQRVA